MSCATQAPLGRGNRRRGLLASVALTLAVTTTGVTFHRAPSASAQTPMVAGVKHYVGGQLQPSRFATVLERSTTSFVADISMPIGVRRVEIRAPLGHDFTLTPSFLVTAGAATPTTGTLRTGGTCESPLPGIVHLERLQTTASVLTQVAIRFSVGCTDSAFEEIGIITMQGTEESGIQVLGINWTTTETLGTVSAPRLLRIASTGAIPFTLHEVVRSSPDIIVADSCNDVVVGDNDCEVEIRLRLLTEHESPGDRVEYLELRTSLTDDLTVPLRVPLWWPRVEPPPMFSPVIGAAGGSSNGLPLVGDFDGDGVDHDLIWWGPTPARDDDLFLSDGATARRSRLHIPWADGYWAIVGNFDGDRRAEIVFYGVGARPDVLWTYRGSARGAIEPLVIGGDRTPVVGDFDGNGVSDIIWWDRAADRHAAWYFELDGSFARRTLSFNGGYDDLVVAPLNNDRRDDLIFWRERRDRHPAWTMAGRRNGTLAILDAPFDAYPIPAELGPRDRAKDLFWWRYNASTHRIARSAAAYRLEATVRSEHGATPVIANFDGDNQGLDDLAWDHENGYKTSHRGVIGGFETRLAFGPLIGWPTTRIIVGHFQDVRQSGAWDVLWRSDGLGLHYRGRDIDSPNRRWLSTRVSDGTAVPTTASVTRH